MKMQTPFFLIFLSIHFYATKGQWVDPHSMDTTSKNKLPNRSQNTPNENPGKHTTFIKTQSDSDVHLRRIVRLILSNAYLDDFVGYREGYLNIKLTETEHQFLLKFSQSGEIEEHTISEISSIFENAIQKTNYDRYEEIVLSLQEKMFYLVFNPTTGALFVACLVLFITYKLLRAQFTWRYIVKYFLFLMYLADFIITYLHVIQEQEIDNMVALKNLGTVPPECDYQKMSWTNYFKTQLKSVFSENPCKAYYQVAFQNYKYFVAPSKVLTRQFRTVIVEPGGDIGEAFGKFGRGLFNTLPWGLNVVLFPIMLIVSCVLIFILFLFITKPHFKISLFHLFSIELGKSMQNEVPRLRAHEARGREIEYRNPARRRRNRNTGREVGHRALVQEVSNDNNTSSSGESSPKKSNSKGIEEKESEKSASDMEPMKD